jgi:hypothetical protein
LKPLSLLKISLFILMWMASFTIRSMYPDVLSRMVMLLKSIWWPVFRLCSATADFWGWSRRMCLTCSLHNPAQKRAVLSTLVRRAKTLCDPESLREEIKSLKDTFQRNRYSPKDIRRVVHPK